MAVIEIDGLTKRYGRGETAVLAVEDLDLSVGAGEVFGFLGPNGAGKSTTINVLVDHVRPTAGEARILGKDVNAEATAIRRQLGVLPEGLGLYDRLTGRRHLEFAIDWMDADTDPAALFDRVGLSPADAARPVGSYSTGMRQRLALGMALVGEPAVLILDEPSAGLDPHGIRRMREIVRAEADRGATVFFSSHVLAEVEAVCDRVGILSAGQLVAVDDVARLRQTVASGSTIRLRVDQPLEVDVTALDGVAAAVHTGGELRVDVTDPHAKATVVATLVDAGLEVRDIATTEPSLEDVFAAYTGADERPALGRDDAATPEVSA